MLQSPVSWPRLGGRSLERGVGHDGSEAHGGVEGESHLRRLERDRVGAQARPAATAAHVAAVLTPRRRAEASVPTA